MEPRSNENDTIVSGTTTLQHTNTRRTQTKQCDVLKLLPAHFLILKKTTQARHILLAWVATFVSTNTLTTLEPIHPHKWPVPHSHVSHTVASMQLTRNSVPHQIAESHSMEVVHGPSEMF